MPTIIQRLEAGESLNSICISLGTQRDIAAQLVRAERPGLIQPPKKRFIAPEVKRKAVAEYMNGTDSCKAVGKRYGVGHNTIWRWAYEAMGVEV